jgi:hypothetical protein
MIMKALFAAVSALACMVGSAEAFARGGSAHAFGLGHASAARSAPAFVQPSSELSRAPGSYGFNRGYYGGADHGWHGGPSFFRGGDVD